MARLSPMRSVSIPANGALAAYVSENAVRISPYCALKDGIRPAKGRQRSKRLPVEIVNRRGEYEYGQHQPAEGRDVGRADHWNSMVAASPAVASRHWLWGNTRPRPAVVSARRSRASGPRLPRSLSCLDRGPAAGSSCGHRPRSQACLRTEAIHLLQEALHFAGGFGPVPPRHWFLVGSRRRPTVLLLNSMHLGPCFSFEFSISRLSHRPRAGARRPHNSTAALRCPAAPAACGPAAPGR